MTATDSHEKLLSDLVGDAYPPIRPSANSEERFVRRWVIRSKDPVPEGIALEHLRVKILAIAEAAIASAYAGSVPEERLNRAMPGIRLACVDPNHCVVEVEVPAPPNAFGDEAGIGTWASLRAIDSFIGIVDLQGLPRRLWFQLR